MNLQKRWPDFLIPAGLIACLTVILVPLPPALMDVLLAANLTLAIVMLLSTIYAKSPMELSLFPAFLLGTTLARLALNIGTTRLILTRGPQDHEQAAGDVIASFSNFVTGDSIAIGLVIFSIIVVVQFVVIAKGATRISEVSARFSLDGMPGRQMAIEAELNSGAIDAEQAKALRREASEQADFYGAMDGASKFVRGDAIAGVLITLINIVGGLTIGLTHNMSLPDAAATFTKLTIGDGLVSQLPALLIALAAGILVTRSHRKTDLSREAVQQVLAKPIVLVTAAVFLGLLVLTKLPMIPLLSVGAICLLFAWTGSQQKSNSESDTAPEPPAPVKEISIDRLLTNDLMEIELGLDLIRLVDAKQGGTLLQGVSSVRQQVAAELGIILPKIRIRDNLKLGRKEYRVMIQGNAVERASLEPDHLLAMDCGSATKPLENGVVVGLASESIAQPGYWIEASAWEQTELAGYRIRSCTEVLTAQLKKCSIANANELLTRDATAQLMDELKKSSPTIVNEIVPDVLPLADVQTVLQSLLEEGVSIRPLHLIMETIGSVAPKTKTLTQLVEKIRMKLARHISGGLATDSHGAISVFTISEELQNRIACAWSDEGDELHLDMPNSIVEMLIVAMNDASSRMSAAGLRPVALVDQSIRPVVAELCRKIGSNPFVIGDRELEGVHATVFGEITSEQLSRLERSAA
ncbi:flagellar biosynthesis protein FlhA [Mariniblastus fucicola]|uniref:Flagellar biosynthesis protein FlhA n=1 Tax=Mariniblastus fucicola TaxID=980251 RepID=A0A5B9PAI7_9BACT|nr:flagellar biosynthesis protein FlhA [Mariniblastus fucicola]QEG23284.1 Flagellar biosynthesis protein FlhA [Mariniblastus fucicola]